MNHTPLTNQTPFQRNLQFLKTHNLEKETNLLYILVFNSSSKCLEIKHVNDLEKQHITDFIKIKNHIQEIWDKTKKSPSRQNPLLQRNFIFIHTFDETLLSDFKKILTEVKEKFLPFYLKKYLSCFGANIIQFLFPNTNSMNTVIELLNVKIISISRLGLQGNLQILDFLKALQQFNLPAVKKLDFTNLETTNETVQQAALFKNLQLLETEKDPKITKDGIYFLLLIAKKLVKTNPKEALKITQQATSITHSIQDENAHLKIQFLIEIAEVQMQCDPKEGVKTFELAIKTTEKHKMAYFKATDLAKIASAQFKMQLAHAPQTLKQAISTTTQIKDLGIRADALAKIAKQLNSFDPTQALTTIQKAISTIHSIQDENPAAKTMSIGVVVKTLEEIAKTQPKNNLKIVQQTFQSLIQIASSINSVFSKIPCLIKIITPLSHIHPSQAITTIMNEIDLTNQITDNTGENKFYKEYALIKLSKILAKTANILSETNPKQALESLKKTIEITNQLKENDRDEKAKTLTEIAIALAKIANILSKTNSKQADLLFQQAINTAKQIQDKETRAKTLAEVANTLSKTNPKQAQVLFQQAVNTANEYEKYKTLITGTLLKVATIQMKDHPVLAINTLNLAFNTIEKAEEDGVKQKQLSQIVGAFSKTAKEQEKKQPQLAKTALSLAFNVLKKVTDYHSRTHALIDLANALIPADLEKAKTFLQTAIKTINENRNGSTWVLEVQMKVDEILENTAKTAKALRQTEPKKALQLFQLTLDLVNQVKGYRFNLNTLHEIAKQMD